MYPIELVARWLRKQLEDRRGWLAIAIGQQDDKPCLYLYVEDSDDFDYDKWKDVLEKPYSGYSVVLKVSPLKVAV